MNHTEITAMRHSIIRAALPHVPFDGWYWETIERAAQDSGYEQDIARAVFPGGMKDVLDGFADLADQEMLTALEDTNPDDLRIRERIRTALMARYEWLTSHKEALRQALQFWAVPTRKPRAAQIVWRSADRIWDWAGDTASDYNHYTKRGLLSGIMASSTTLVFINDTSPHLDNTQAFLDRRIENVLHFGKWINTFKKAS